MIRSIRFLSLLLLNASILRGRLLGDDHRKVIFQQDYKTRANARVFLCSLARLKDTDQGSKP